MDAAATGRPYTHAVTGRVGLMAALLLVSAACGSGGPAGANVPAAGIVGPWQPVPFTLPGQIVEAADRACRASFPDFPQQTRLMVVDARGAGRIEAQYAGPNGLDANCGGMTIDATGRIEPGGGGTGMRGKEFGVLQAFELESIAGYSSAEASSTSGRAGPGVARVVLAMPGQPPVTASLTNGWYLAWWPGEWPPGTKIVGLEFPQPDRHRDTGPVARRAGADATNRSGHDGARRAFPRKADSGRVSGCEGCVVASTPRLPGMIRRWGDSGSCRGI